MARQWKGIRILLLAIDVDLSACVCMCVCVHCLSSTCLELLLLREFTLL